MIGSAKTDLARTEKIPPPDMITVLLLPPPYHFPGFSRRSRPLSFIWVSSFMSLINFFILLLGYVSLGNLYQKLFTHPDPNNRSEFD
jgi:hypothetical protein